MQNMTLLFYFWLMCWRQFGDWNCDCSWQNHEKVQLKAFDVLLEFKAVNSKQWIQSSEIKVKDFRWGNSYCIEKDEHRFLNPTKIFVLGKHEQTVQDLNPYFMKNCSFDTSLNNAISKIAIKEIFTLIWNGP